MKHLILSFILVSVMISCSIFRPNMLGRMAESERETYLIELGKEVVLAFGPGYYREYKHPLISEVKIFEDSDMRPEIQKCVGRKYYAVTFLYDRSKERLEWDYAAQVDIWQDTGKPMGVTFGNGYGKNFIFKSYKEQLLMPDRKVMPYRDIPMEPFPDIWNGEEM